MHPTAWCSISAGAHIFTAANVNWLSTSVAGWKTPASPIRSLLPVPLAPLGLLRIMANRQAMPAARSLRCWRHWHCPPYGFPPCRAGGAARAGLKRIGDSADQPRAPLTARFGAEVLRQLDRALGHEHEPLTPRLPVAPYVAEQRFAEPIAREEDVLTITARLARQLQFALER